MRNLPSVAMSRLVVNTSLLFASLCLGCIAKSGRDPRTVHDFDAIEPSANLTWAPCLDGFSCSRLQVPLDYSNPGLGTTDIAFIKLAGKNATSESPSIVIIPGGPGGSGVETLLANRATVGQMLGEQYNFVSFDPRGVNNSGLHLDCFSGNAEARSTFNRLHMTGATNITSSSLAEQYYTSSIYGEWCNNAVANSSPHGYYVTTPAVAHDLLTFIEAEAESAGRPPSDAKLWCYGISYGTLVGTTFASLFPDRVGRMVLDGVLNAEEYYDNYWTDNFAQMDEAIALFSDLCHSAGPERCAFWGSTPGDIMTRVDNIVRKFETHPVAVSGLPGRAAPALVTYSDLKALLLNAIYAPRARFPVMAGVLSRVEQGDVSGLVGQFESLKFTDDARLVIQCADSYRRNKLVTLEDFRVYIELAVSKSRYIGDVHPIYVDTILCRSFRPELPDGMVMRDPVGGSTSFPILFTSNTVDPITPLISAQKMSSQFPGSVVLRQEAIGHTVVDQGGSICYFGHVQAYFQGVVPSANATCPQQFTPFMD